MTNTATTKWLSKLRLILFTIATGFALVMAREPARGNPNSPANATANPTTRPADRASPKSSDQRGKTSPVMEPKQRGGEPAGIVQVANLIYAGTKSSKCFADHFLVEAEKKSSISTSRRFHAVKLSSDELYEFPLAIMTGEGAFTLTGQERENLRKYLERGGFLVASAGCSSHEWDRSFRSEMSTIFPDLKLKTIEMTHVIFHTVFDIKELQAKHDKPRPLEGITIDGRLSILYSQDGLNDTSHTQGCCCCGGNEITNAIKVNVNVLAYALVR